MNSLMVYTQCYRSRGSLGDSWLDLTLFIPLKVELLGQSGPRQEQLWLFQAAFSGSGTSWVGGLICPWSKIRKMEAI